MTSSSLRRRAALAVGLAGCVVSLLASPALAAANRTPLRLHPDNSHYFEFRGQATTLITSAEHYGAVLNLDFDYKPYLKALRRERFNLTRIFSGAYVERDSSIPSLGYRNTLAPRPGRFLAPWSRSNTPGYANGGNKFDLDRWDPAYFKRLKDFVAEAGRRGVVVEVVLFCPFYGDDQWTVSPMHPANNVNGVGAESRQAAYDVNNPGLLHVQEELTRKLVTELNGFDNVYFELANEPYFGVPADFQRHIGETIVDTEGRLPKRHLIAQNIANGSQRVTDPDPNVSIFNFHYATPPLAVDQNADLGRAIVDDETGFAGTGDAAYRREGWEFMLAGGSGYNNLDWSFTPGHEDGSDVPLNPATPGGGTPALRRQLSHLVRFLDHLPLVRMHPDDTVIDSGVPAGARAQVLVEHGRAYGIYVNGDGVQSLRLRLPAGGYSARWIDPKTGATVRFQRVNTSGAGTDLDAPAYSQDLALRVIRTGVRRR